MVKAVVSESIIGRSEKKDLVKFHILNLFDYADSPHFRIDDYPFGGGPGMVLKPEPIFRALDDIKEKLSFLKHETLPDIQQSLNEVEIQQLLEQQIETPEKMRNQIFET